MSSPFSSLPQSDIIIALGHGRPQQCRLMPSFSMPDVNGLGLSHTFGSIWSPNLLSASLLEHIQTHHPKVSTFLTAFNALRVQFSRLKHRIYNIDTENNELRHANMVLRSDSQALEQELSNLRAEYYSERLQTKVRVQCARADKDKIMILSDKLEQAEKFIMAMVDIKLHEPVLGRAAEAVKEGADAEEALVEAVRVAATKKGSAWSRIIPAIVGPRSPEHYLSAINLALMLQRDLHEREKVSGFWKAIAKLDPVNINTITPSSSLLSEMGGPDIEHSVSEQAVLDEMIALLATGDTLARKRSAQAVLPYSTEAVTSELVAAEGRITERTAASTPIVDLSTIQFALYSNPVSPVSSLPATKEHGPQATPLTESPKTVNIAGDSPPMKISQIPVSPLRSKAKTSQIAQSKLPSSVSQTKVISSISPAKQASPLKISSKQPITPIRKVPSTPIRSRLSTPRTNAFKRPVLTNIDLNRPLVKSNTYKIVTKRIISANISDDTIKKKSTRDNSKNLVKRRGVIMEAISHPPASIVAKNENSVLPMTAEIEMYEPRASPLPTSVAKNTEENNSASTSISAEDQMHISPPSDKESSLQYPEFDLSPENIKHGPLLAAQALQSLERICAAFSSDSLGSLEMTDAGSDPTGSQSDSENLHSTNEHGGDAVPPASSSNLSHICQALHDLECSMADNNFSEDSNFFVNENPPRPPTPLVKCAIWASSTPRHMSSKSAVSSSSSFSESISIPTSLFNKKFFESDGSPTPAKTPFKPSPKYPTDRLAKPLKHTFYKAVPPLQNGSLLPIQHNPDNDSQQPLPPSQNKPFDDKKLASFGFSPASFSSKPQSNTINTVSLLPPTLSTPVPETLSSASPSKRRSSTINTISPVSPTRRSPRPKCLIPITKPRSNTINTTSPVSRPHTAKTVSSSAKRRSNTLDSYLQVPNNNARSPARPKAVYSQNDTTVPTAAFMRRPDMKTRPVNNRRMTNSAAPLIPTWSPASHTGALSPTQYRNMLRGGIIR